MIRDRARGEGRGHARRGARPDAAPAREPATRRGPPRALAADTRDTGHDAVARRSRPLAELVASLREQNRRLHREARTDVRTGLANSRALTEIEHTAVGMPDSPWASCAVVFVDVDQFGAFNKLYGDHAGDEALRCLADVLRHAGRRSDQVFRKGGEEFVMVLPQADQGAAERIAASLAAGIAALRIPHADGPTGWLSALIVATSVWAGETVAQAIARAGDAAMRCKAAGVRAQVLFQA